MAFHLSSGTHDITTTQEAVDCGSTVNTRIGYKRLLESSSESDEYDSSDAHADACADDTTTAQEGDDCGSIGNIQFGYKGLLESFSESDENNHTSMNFLIIVDGNDDGLRSGQNDQQDGDQGAHGGQNTGIIGDGLGAGENNQQGGVRGDGGQRVRGGQGNHHSGGQNDDVEQASEQVFKTFMQMGLNRGAGRGKILNIRD